MAVVERLRVELEESRHVLSDLQARSERKRLLTFLRPRHPSLLLLAFFCVAHLSALRESTQTLRNRSI